MSKRTYCFAALSLALLFACSRVAGKSGPAAQCASDEADCGESCCTAGQECREGRCVAACATVRCGEICCLDGDTCADGACVPVCPRTCTRADGSQKECGEDGCGGVCGTCSTGRSCSTTYACEHPMNDACASAFRLEFDAAGVARDTVDVSAAGAGMTVGCAQSHGRNLVYRFALSDRKKVSVRVETDPKLSRYAYEYPALELRRSCEGPAVRCTSGSEATTWGIVEDAIPVLLAGEYYLVIDTADPEWSGTVTTTIMLEDPAQQPPPNGTCETAQFLEFDEYGHAQIDGDTTYALNSHSPRAARCDTHETSIDGADLVYAVQLTKPSRLMLNAVFEGRTAGYVYAATGCGAGARYGWCGRGWGSREEADYTYRTEDAVAAGTYYIVVDDASFFGGPFHLDVWVGFPPPNDNCSSVQALQFDGNRRASASGDTTFANEDSHGSPCSRLFNRNRDVVYSFTLEEQSFVAIEAVPAPGVFFAPVVEVTTHCPELKNVCLTCAAAPQPGNAALLHIPALAAGTYFVWIDALTAGPFALTVTAGPPVLNDTCAHPLPIPFDAATQRWRVRGDTSKALDDFSGSCQPEGQSSADLVYQFTLDTEQAVSVSVLSLAAGYSPALFVRASCAAPADEVGGGCFAPREESVQIGSHFAVLAAGSYYLFVDGARGSGGAPSEGKFELTVETSAPPPVPPGDGCGDVLPLQLVATADPATRRATASGSTATARDDARGSGYCERSRAGDLVYGLHLDAKQKVTATVTPTVGAPYYRPVVYVRRSCASTADSDQVACAAAASGGAAASAVADSLVAGDYFVWVDGVTSGGFELLVEATSPEDAGPSNDSCTAPQVLPDGWASTSFTGTTLGARDDFPLLRYPDVVYSFTLPSPKRLSISLTPYGAGTSLTDSSFVLQRQCANAGPHLAWASSRVPGEPAATVVPFVPQGQWFLWVENEPAGNFLLALEAYEVNDLCSHAQALTLWPDGLQGDVTFATDDYGTTGGFSTVCAAEFLGISSTPGRDVVFAFTAPDTRDYVAWVLADFDAIVWVTEAADCGVPSACIALDDPAAYGQPHVLFHAVAGHTYSVIIDSTDPAATGEFNIRLN